MDMTPEKVGGIQGWEQQRRAEEKIMGREAPTPDPVRNWGQSSDTVEPGHIWTFGAFCAQLAPSHWRAGEVRDLWDNLQKSVHDELCWNARQQQGALHVSVVTGLHPLAFTKTCHQSGSSQSDHCTAQCAFLQLQIHRGRVVV